MLNGKSLHLERRIAMHFDNTTIPATRAAIARAHQERGKVLSEIWNFLTGRL